MTIGAMIENTSVVDGKGRKENKKSNYRGGAGLLVVSGITAIAAGVVTTIISKKRGRQYLTLHGHELEELPESGTALALKALCYSTIITLGVFSVSIFGLCKWFDIKNWFDDFHVEVEEIKLICEEHAGIVIINMDDLRAKIRHARQQRPPNPYERTEFENLSDFLNYLNEKYGKSEAEKSRT